VTAAEGLPKCTVVAAQMSKTLLAENMFAVSRCSNQWSTEHAYDSDLLALGLGHHRRRHVACGVQIISQQLREIESLRDFVTAIAVGSKIAGEMLATMDHKLAVCLRELGGTE
jgi:hypothetical protein